MTSLLLLLALSGQHMDRTERILLTTDTITRGVDAYSTVRALDNPNNHEINAILGRHPSPLAVWAYSAGVAYGQLCLGEFLEAHHHPRWAHVAAAADIAYDGALAGHNLTLNPHVKAGEIRFRF